MDKIIIILMVFAAYGAFRFLSAHGGKWLNSDGLLAFFVKVALSIVIGYFLFSFVGAIIIIVLACLLASGKLFRFH